MWKTIISYVALEDFYLLFERLSPRGVWILSAMGVSVIGQANNALGRISKWTKKANVVLDSK